MKKIHLIIIAVAALLLSGGVFVKANNEMNVMFYGMIEAITSDGDNDCYLYGDGEGGGHYDGEYAPRKDPSQCGATVLHLHKGTNTDCCYQCECKILQLNGSCNDNKNLGYYQQQGWHTISTETLYRTVCVFSGKGCTWQNAAQHGSKYPY